MGKNKYIIGILFFSLIMPNISAQENEAGNENWFKRHFEQRMYMGFYDSFGDEKANVLQVGYDAVFNFISISPTWTLLDFCLGLDVLVVRDQINKESVDNFGHIRSTENRLIPGFEINWGVRLYFPTIPKIKTSIYLEAVPISFVVYTKPYPDNGTNINVGTHLGLGMKFPINDILKIYTTFRWFSHTSNGRPEENNPALDLVGIIFGLQF